MEEKVFRYSVKSGMASRGYGIFYLARSDLVKLAERGERKERIDGFLQNDLKKGQIKLESQLARLLLPGFFRSNPLFQIGNPAFPSIHRHKKGHSLAKVASSYRLASRKSSIIFSTALSSVWPKIKLLISYSLKMYS